MHNENITKYNDLAATEIFAATNPGYGDGEALGTCDLHNLFLREAKMYCNMHLAKCRTAGLARMHIVVGRGVHSTRGQAILQPEIKNMLDGMSGIVATFEEGNVGRIVVEFVAAD